MMVRPVVGGTIDIITGTEENSVNIKNKVYPNPSKGFLYWDNDAVKEVSLYNMEGKLKVNKKNATSPLNISAFPDGKYLLKLKGLKTSIVEKIIIKK
jgi:hypothetical protein